MQHHSHSTPLKGQLVNSQYLEKQDVRKVDANSEETSVDGKQDVCCTMP